MKYMGSKRTMLTNGLGHLLSDTIEGHERFVDLFCGSGAVSAFVAQKSEIPVLASDLQKYATTLTAAVICQTAGFDAIELFEKWKVAATDWIQCDKNIISVMSKIGLCPSDYGSRVRWINDCQKLALEMPDRYVTARMYGGYYFSLTQALAIDALRATIEQSHRDQMLAALISAASTCAAAPGHTAQPFSTTPSSLPHLLHAWNRDVFRETLEALKKLSMTWAKVKGDTQQADALDVTEQLVETDLVFIDPPYSEVQYSRFYHVLESITSNSLLSTSGTGRYPPLSQRPQSKYCRTSQSIEEFNKLMMSIAAQGADAIVTFPSGVASNGLSGLIVENISAQYFKVKRKEVSSLFSTLGGNSFNRSARQGTKELLLYLSPV